MNSNDNFGKPDVFHANFVFLIRDGRVWLAIKQRKIGAGKHYSWGGGIDEGETIEESTVRELREESGGKNDPKDPMRGLRARPEDLRKVAFVTFVTNKEDGSKFTVPMHVFILESWEGEPEATDEMGMPEWHDISRLPLHNMMPADLHWWPKVLNGELGTCTYQYNHDRTKLIEEPVWIPVDRFED